MSWTITGSQKVNWTPANIATNLWFDANDTSTVILNGSAVSQWNDKSGNSRNLTASGTQQPSWNATGLNSKPTITFDGSNDILATTSSGSAGVTTCTLIALMKYETGGASEDLALGLGRAQSSTNDGKQRAFYRTVNGTTQGFATWARDATSSSISCDVGGTHHIFVADHRNNSSVHLFRDGTIDTGAPRALAGTGSTSNPVELDWFSIGSLQGSLVANYYSNVSVSEVLIFYTSIADYERRRIEGYLAHKWGLVASLPNDHPYKVNPPAP